MYFDTMVVRRRIGHDAFGEQVLGDGREVAAHIEPSEKMVIDARGRQAVGSLRAFCANDAKVEVGDVVNYRDKSYFALRVDDFSLEGTPHHLEVTLGEFQPTDELR
jgi:hypothetical protein